MVVGGDVPRLSFFFEEEVDGEVRPANRFKPFPIVEKYPSDCSADIWFKFTRVGVHEYRDVESLFSNAVISPS